MNRSFLALSLFMLIALLPPALSAQTDWDFGGSVESVYGGFIHGSRELSSSVVRFSPHWEGYAGPLYFRAELDGEYNGLIPAYTGLSLGETYMEYGGRDFDIRIGRQIISWGKSDGIQITDIVSPKDYTGVCAVEYEDTRIPVNGVKFRVFGMLYTLETVWIPLFTPSQLAQDGDNPLTGVNFPGYDQYVFEEADLPKEFGDGEYGARLSLFFPLLDLGFSFFSGWEDIPEYQFAPSGSTLTLTPEYYRTLMGGVDGAIPLNAFVLRFEAAWTGGRRFYRADSSTDEKDQIQALGGIDWNPGGGWSLSAQYYEDILIAYDDTLARDEREPALSLSLSKTLFRDRLSLSWTGMAHGGDWDSLSSLEGEYEISDGFHASLGCDLYFSGPGEEGTFGAYEELSGLWLKGRYQF